MYGGLIMAIRIFIDQGHNPGGVNGGAEGNGLLEQDVTYNVGIYLNNLLNSDSRFVSEVSRKTPDEILGINNTTSLQNRVNQAINFGADYFISIHCNASDNPAYNGTEIFVYRDNTPVYDLATDILEEIVENLGTKNNGVKENRGLFVLRRTPMPAMLIELAFITNPQDAFLLETRQYDFAEAIYEGILEYFDFD